MLICTRVQKKETLELTFACIIRPRIQHRVHLQAETQLISKVFKGHNVNSLFFLVTPIIQDKH